MQTRYLFTALFLLAAGCEKKHPPVVSYVPNEQYATPVAQPVVQAAPAPVIINQQPSDSGMPGWMMFHLLNNASQPSRVIEHRTVYHAPAPTPIPVPSYRPAPMPHRPVYSKPAAPSSPGRYSSGGSYSRPVSRPSSSGRYSSGGRR